MRDLLLFQKIKNVRPAIHAVRLERTFLFAEIVECNVLERNVVKIEIAFEAELVPNNFGKPATKNASACQGCWQPPQWPQKSKRRIFWIINKITPVAMFLRPAPGENRGHAG